jgi:hypothetical protein
MKSLAHEMPEFEKGMARLLNVEDCIDGLFYDLNSCVVESDRASFRMVWDSWVQDMPKDGDDVGMLENIQFTCPIAKKPKAIYATYFKNFSHCLMRAVAAQRAFDRSDTDTPWRFLVDARTSWAVVYSEHERFDRDEDTVKIEIQKKVRAAANGGLRGERIRYKLVVLLHEARRRQVTEFKDIASALKVIERGIADYLDENKFSSSYANLEPNMWKWLREQPAFRAELQPLFIAGCLETEPRAKPAPGS